MFKNHNIGKEGFYGNDENKKTTQRRPKNKTY